MFYEPVWEYEGCQVVGRPDTPNYYIYWTDQSRGRVRRKSTGTEDLDAAKRELIAFVRELELAGSNEPQQVLMLDVLSDYAESQSGNSRSYAWRTKHVLRLFTEFTDRTGPGVVSEFTQDQQARYLEWRKDSLRQTGVVASNATLNYDLSIIKAALRYAWKHGRLTEFPHIQLLKNPPSRDRFLREHEVRRLLAECHTGHVRLFVLLALHTLQRPGAIFSLHRDQIDLEWNRIDFLPPGQIQSNKRKPVVPITPTLRPHLEEAMLHSNTGFIIEWERRPVQSVKNAFKKACKRAKLENVSPYTLRHTGATLMASRGVPLRQIAGMLGHSETKTTELYAKHHPDFLNDAAAALEQMFGEGRTA